MAVEKVRSVSCVVFTAMFYVTLFMQCVLTVCAMLFCLILLHDLLLYFQLVQAAGGSTFLSLLGP